MSAPAGVSAARAAEIVTPHDSRSQRRKRAQWEGTRVSSLEECKKLSSLVWEHPIEDIGSVIEKIQSLCKRLREYSERLSKSSPGLRTAFAGRFTDMLTVLEWVGKQGFHRKESYEIRQLVNGVLKSDDVLEDVERWTSTQTVALSVEEVVQQRIIARAQPVEARIKGIIKLLEGYCEELTTSTLTLREGLKQDYTGDLARWKQDKKLLFYKITLDEFEVRICDDLNDDPGSVRDVINYLLRCFDRDCAEIQESDDKDGYFRRYLENFRKRALNLLQYRGYHGFTACG